MKRTVVTCILGLLVLTIQAQTKAEALAEFDWLTGFVQRNYAGYDIKTQGKDFSKDLRKAIEQHPDTLPLVATEYVRRFKDGHLWLNLTKEGQQKFNPIMRRMWDRERAKGNKSTSTNMYYTAKAMNDSTFFLRIPSFGDSTSMRLVENNWDSITARPYLIVDLRCNGGGDDQYFQPLLKLIYSQPYYTHGVEMNATQDFLNLYRNVAKYDADKEWGPYYKAMADSVEAHLGHYVLRPDEKRVNLIKQDTVYSNPRRVGILIHRRNASSAEQFIIEAKESEKVTLFGNENTGGVIDLSNVYSINSPLGWLELRIPTTRSCRWPDIIIDGKGIAPQLPVPYKESLQERSNIGEEIKYIERVLRGIQN